MALAKAAEAREMRSVIVFNSKPNVFLEHGILKRARFTPLFLVLSLMALSMVACGGGGSSSSNASTSRITHRVLVSNSFQGASTGALQIVDYSKDQLSTFQMGCCVSWTRMLPSPDGTRTYAIEAPPNAPGIGIFDNASETKLGFMPTSSTVSAFTTSSDNKFIYTAVRNGAASTGVPGTVEFADTTTSTLTVQNVPVPLATNVVLSHNGSKLLVFSDQSDSVNIVDPVAKTATAVPGFDRPVTAFFTADDTHAYVIDCGAECGGTQAGVVVLDLTNPTAPLPAAVPVPAATAALLDGNNLYLAGTAPTGGVLSFLTVSGNTVATNGAPVSIGDGFHQVLVTGDGKLFVGARTCSTGCLTIVDLTSHAAVTDVQKGDVTGATPIPNRHVFYVVEGGEVHIYDTTTNQEVPNVVIDIVGQASDVLVIDKG
jgi:hypothetical protein